MKKTRSQRTLIGRNKSAFYWLIGDRTKLQRRTPPGRTQLQRSLFHRFLDFALSERLEPGRTERLGGETSAFEQKGVMQ